jgi:hypothetical protein
MGANRYNNLFKKADFLAGNDPKPDDLYHWAENVRATQQ